MSEQARLKELKSYHIMDSIPERRLDEIAEIALSICDTPISLLTFLDAERQWFKAAKGIATRETPRKYSFCHYTLFNPDEVLVIEDLLEDKRFKNNPFVLDQPGVRFYAGAPLKTPNGHVIGTLCVIDYKPGNMPEHKKNALKLLARNAMEHLNKRKDLIDQTRNIELDVEHLKKRFDLAPGIFFQFELDREGKKSIYFTRKDIAKIHPHLDPQNLMDMPETALKVIHPDDVDMVHDSIQHSLLKLTNWDIEFRVVSSKGNTRWYCGNANLEKKKDGSAVWYGSLQNINNKKEYEEILEQILFDISHILRRPITKMLGITSLIEEENLDEGALKLYAENLKAISKEMDAFTKKLSMIYGIKRQNLHLKNKIRLNVGLYRSDRDTE